MHKTDYIDLFDGIVCDKRFSGRTSFISSVGTGGGRITVEKPEKNL